jgi:putative sugar O-methyltransferase
MLSTRIEALIRQESGGAAHRNYTQVRPLVLKMMFEMEQETQAPSDYWREELDGFDYLLDATPLVVSKLRQHCFHITGLRSYEYRRHHAHMKGVFETKLKALRSVDKAGLFVPESPEMGGFGHEIDGSLVNVDTLKFYESLIVMNHAGLLDHLRRTHDSRAVVLEIGAGWGGFAYQLKTLFQNVCYIIVDLPQTLLISSVYLKTLFPQARCLMYGETPFESLLTNFRSYDFFFLPHYALQRLRIEGIDVAVNMVSFQEMTNAQVEGYLEWLAQMRCPNIYSHNRDRSKHNPQMSSVSSLLQRFFEIEELRPLPVPYTVLTLPKKPEFKWPKTQSAKNIIRELMRYYLRVTEEKKVAATDYRHFVGRMSEVQGRLSEASCGT